MGTAGDAAVADAIATDDPTTEFATAAASDDLSGSDLPFTGFDVAAVAAIGALALAGGALLRRLAVRRGAV